MSEDRAVVPEGHRVDIYRASPSPGVVRSTGGVWLAHVGVSSDEQEEELDRVLGEVEGILGSPRPRILLTAVHGSISSLMAPANPKLTPVSGHLAWTLDAAALAGAPRAPALVQRLLWRMYATSRAAITQSVFARNADAPPAFAVVALIGELGIQVRTPEPEEMAVLAEVHRPEGVILSALLGAPHEKAPAAGSWALEVNDEKDRAGNRERLIRLEEEERRELEERLAPDGGARRVAAVDRAPRLRRLLLAVAREGGAAAKKALYRELLGREIPLLFMVDPRTRGAGLSSWPGGLEALAVYGDKASLLTSARDLGLPMGSFAFAEMTSATLFAWGAGQGWAMAICLFAEPDRPVYVSIPSEDVRALAEGRAGVEHPPP